MKLIFFILFISSLINLFSCFFLELAAVGGVAWFLGDKLFGAVDNTIDRAEAAGHRLLEDVKTQANKVVNELIESQIKPLSKSMEMTATKITEGLNSALEQSRKDAELMRDQFEKMMEKMLNKYEKLGEELVTKFYAVADYHVERLRVDVIDYGMSRLSEFKKECMTDIRNILRIVEDLILRASCMMNSTAKRIDDSLTKFIPDPYPSDKCRQELDVLFPNQHMMQLRPTSFTDSQLYYYRKCDLSSKVDENSSIQATFMIYSDLLKLAADMRCLAVSLNMAEVEIYYLEEMAYFSNLVKIVNNIRK
jgi:uncharacterized coiled-coil protein SlyX